MKVLITGGAGYIGSTVASACADAGLFPIVLDDLSTGLRMFAERFPFYEGDYGDPALLARVFGDHADVAAVVHCAASVVVPESMTDPVRYYANNVAKLPAFLSALLRSPCRRVVFSSTAAVYAATADLVVHETSPIDPGNPYAASKAMAERIFADTAAATGLRVVALRYFNPIGADPSGRTGQSQPQPSHVLGRLLAAHEGGAPFTVTGTDWPTRDGSGLRDYVHVWDLARAHVAALQRFDNLARIGCEVVNLGTGTGTTVRELLAAFEQVTGTRLEVRTAPPRPGDVAGACAAAAKAARMLGWTAQRSVAEGIADALAWRERLPGVLGLHEARPNPADTPWE
jgi:UDP-glucose 4-epimerase